MKREELVLFLYAVENELKRRKILNKLHGTENYNRQSFPMAFPILFGILED